MSKREIAATLGVSATAAGEYIRQRGARPGLADTGRPGGRSAGGPALSAARGDGEGRRPQPYWAAVHRELRRPGVTLQLLWEEHRAVRNSLAAVIHTTAPDRL